ncbi:Oidioi.mRNA.OKI2018_I69.XSR.g15277.t1.cds [Oikopleura dioica]|uniref:Oidioi.mRNA.OKI2018_I69.XSR.g15277.t1.cds n=1 Tax=Oikopleura dioica TaxID=34765 RepID=A0ABN7SLG4_OIKDI|nr:Oidioi.mRNA.OKI2018_I69.XSR.g15277.t1.cds [Oikopleura dioica]
METRNGVPKNSIPCYDGGFFTSRTELTLKNISRDKKVAYSFKGRGNETGITLKGQKKGFMMPGEHQSLQVVMQNKPQGSNNLCIFWEVHEFESTIQFENCLQKKCESFFNRVRIVPPEKPSQAIEEMDSSIASLNSSFTTISSQREVDLRDLSARFDQMQRQIRLVIIFSVILLVLALYLAFEIQRLN